MINHSVMRSRTLVTPRCKQPTQRKSNKKNSFHSFTQNPEISSSLHKDQNSMIKSLQININIEEKASNPRLSYQDFLNSDTCSPQSFVHYHKTPKNKISSYLMISYDSQIRPIHAGRANNGKCLTVQNECKREGNANSGIKRYERGFRTTQTKYRSVRSVKVQEKQSFNERNKVKGYIFKPVFMKKKALKTEQNAQQAHKRRQEYRPWTKRGQNSDSKVDFI